ncbi:MAG: hypothetical protein ACRDPK_16950 [Carbonactinosporaceae bacterium]
MLTPPCDPVRNSAAHTIASLRAARVRSSGDRLRNGVTCQVLDLHSGMRLSGAGDIVIAKRPFAAVGTLGPQCWSPPV